MFPEVFENKKQFISLIRMDKLINLGLEINESHILFFICAVKRK